MEARQGHSRRLRVTHTPLLSGVPERSAAAGRAHIHAFHGTFMSDRGRGGAIIDPQCVSTQLWRGDSRDNGLINTKSPLRSLPALSALPRLCVSLQGFLGVCVYVLPVRVTAVGCHFVRSQHQGLSLCSSSPSPVQTKCVLNFLLFCRRDSLLRIEFNPFTAHPSVSGSSGEMPKPTTTIPAIKNSTHGRRG